MKKMELIDFFCLATYLKAMEIIPLFWGTTKRKMMKPPPSYISWTP